jgi:toxin ParE1/3/4
MKLIEFSLDAENYILDIFLYSAKNFGQSKADFYYEKLNNCFQIIVENPRIGRLSTGSSEIRRFEHQKHVIFYSENEQGIYIIRIIHRRSLITLSVFH